MSAFSEVRELNNPEISEVKDNIKAFEGKSTDVREVNHISTINEKYEGSMHPETEVCYERKTFKVNGERVEGVFPVFESKMDIRLPRDMWASSDEQQFSHCVKQLARKVENNPDFAKQFTPRQLEQIQNGNPRISGLTWHHSEKPGKMQLVNADIHSRTGHTGGRSIWGGGTEFR